MKRNRDFLFDRRGSMSEYPSESAIYIVGTTMRELVFKNMRDLHPRWLCSSAFEHTLPQSL